MRLSSYFEHRSITSKDIYNNGLGLLLGGGLILVAFAWVALACDVSDNFDALMCRRSSGFGSGKNRSEVWYGRSCVPGLWRKWATAFAQLVRQGCRVKD